MTIDPIEMALYDLAVVCLTAHLTAIAVGHSLPSSSAPSTIRNARPSSQVAAARRKPSFPDNKIVNTCA
jgi:hypothetical protein